MYGECKPYIGAGYGRLGFMIIKVKCMSRLAMEKYQAADIGRRGRTWINTVLYTSIRFEAAI